jgi:hypothetical protein
MLAAGALAQPCQALCHVSTHEGVRSNRLCLHTVGMLHLLGPGTCSLRESILSRVHSLANPHMHCALLSCIQLLPFVAGKWSGLHACTADACSRHCYVTHTAMGHAAGRLLLMNVDAQPERMSRAVGVQDDSRVGAQAPALNTMRHSQPVICLLLPAGLGCWVPDGL